MEIYNIYIDESCHLEHDKSDIMTIGYIKVKEIERPILKRLINEIKFSHKVPQELKWNTISNTKFELYKELIDFFFSSSMEFRSVLIKYKSSLNHQLYNEGDHDIFYYKMIYYLLHNPYVNDEQNQFRVFLDKKDTLGRNKLKKIHEVLDNTYHGYSPFIHFQHIESQESIFIQLADIFIGAIAYKSRKLGELENANKTKIKIIEYIEELSGYRLDEGTEPTERKFNIFDHQPRKRQ